MRKFALIVDGTRYGLNRENGILLTNPTGLGTVSDDSFAGINGSGFFSRVNREVTQGQVIGDLTFFSPSYTKYKSFVDTVVTGTSLQLVYDPDGIEYKADVELAYITKTEMVSGTYLTAPVAFYLKSLWYTEQTISGTGSVNVTAGGQAETGIKVRVTSALTNPTLTLTAGSTEIARAALTVTTSGIFEYSNYPDDSHIQDAGHGDLLQYVDTSYPVFGRTRSAFNVALSGAAMNVTVRKYWRSV